MRNDVKLLKDEIDKIIFYQMSDESTIAEYVSAVIYSFEIFISKDNLEPLFLWKVSPGIFIKVFEYYISENNQNKY